MTSPTFPLDALVGYTVTRVGHVYTLTPTKGPAMTNTLDLCNACDAAPAVTRGGYCAECDTQTPDWFAMGARTMTEQQAAHEAEVNAEADLYHDRAEWREPIR